MYSYLRILKKKVKDITWEKWWYKNCRIDLSVYEIILDYNFEIWNFCKHAEEIWNVIYILETSLLHIRYTIFKTLCYSYLQFTFFTAQNEAITWMQKMYSFRLYFKVYISRSILKITLFKNYVLSFDNGGPKIGSINIYYYILLCRLYIAYIM